MRIAEVARAVCGRTSDDMFAASLLLEDLIAAGEQAMAKDDVFNGDLYEPTRSLRYDLLPANRIVFG